jgi:hypothetical protein
VIRIAITEAAFEAIATTLPLGSVGFERHPEPHVLAKLRALRRPGESYSDAILEAGGGRKALRTKDTKWRVRPSLPGSR